MFKIQLMYPTLKINVYFIFLNIGDLTFGITLVIKTYILERRIFIGHPVPPWKTTCYGAGQNGPGEPNLDDPVGGGGGGGGAAAADDDDDTPVVRMLLRRCADNYSEHNLRPYTTNSLEQQFARLRSWSTYVESRD
jgi:hypothetical protein